MDESVPFFDAHSDYLSRVLNERATGRSEVMATDLLPDMAAGGIEHRVLAIFVEDEFLPEQALHRAMNIAVAFHRELDETPEMAAVTATADDMWATDRDVRTVILGMEGAEPLLGDLSVLDAFYRLGLRILTLTHSRRNAAADGAFYEPRRSGTAGGITDFGVALIERLDELGIVLDVSHLNRTGFWDVVEICEWPFVASHSNCAALYDHPRNLTDDQLRAVADADGVVGMVPLAEFLGDGAIDFDRLLDHVEHAIDIAGRRHVGFGFDFNEYLIPYRSGWDPDDPPFSLVAEIDGDADVHRIATALMDRGYSRETVEMLAADNFKRVFEETLPPAGSAPAGR
ncbi:MAG: dipeptidase [Salinirussus sp.]